MSTPGTNTILQQKYPHHIQSQFNPVNSNPTTQAQPGPQIFTHNFTPILIQYAPSRGRNEWIGPVTLRIFDAKRCRKYYILFIHILQINNTQIILDFFIKKLKVFKQK